MTTPLGRDELALWHAFKRAGETVRSAVAEDIAQATGLSDADFGILDRVDDAGGRLRQNQLAVSMGWHRSRLSHQLTRMAARGLVTRTELDGGVEVVLTAVGRAQVASARPVHASAVRVHLLDRLPEDGRGDIVAILADLARPADV